MIATHRYYAQRILRRARQLGCSCLFAAFLAGPFVVAGNAGPTKKAGEEKKPVEIIAQAGLIQYKSGRKRDPFLNPLFLKKENPNEEAPRGTPPRGIKGTFITQAAFLGVSIRGNRRVAILRGADALSYFLQQGDRLFDGYLKIIDIDSITLVREKRLKSGKVLTEDVTKRLRTP
jgi:hypothetical protein